MRLRCPFGLAAQCVDPGVIMLQILVVAEPALAAEVLRANFDKVPEVYAGISQVLRQDERKYDNCTALSETETLPAGA